MSNDRTQLGRTAPTLPVADVGASCRFYEAALGLEVTFTFEEPATYAVLKKDAAEVHLSRCSDPAPRANPVFHLIVADADWAHGRCVAAGAKVVEALRTAPWGMRTFVFEDPDGHRVDVGQPLGEEPA